ITDAGEAAIARSRIEAELRQSKQALADLNESIARLRTQLREVEIQADSQLQSRRTELAQHERDFDPLEFDRYTRLQELTRMMAEGLADVASLQQALVKNVGETDAALLAQARIGRELQQDLMRMRAKAIEKGLLSPEQLPSESDQVQLIFLSGLSTAGTVTELAGRGVGMDVVRAEIQSIGGRIEVTSARGRGTTFTIYLPLTLA